MSKKGHAVRYNIQMKMADLLENEQAAAAFDRLLPGLRPIAEANPQARGGAVFYEDGVYY